MEGLIHGGVYFQRSYGIGTSPCVELVHHSVIPLSVNIYAPDEVLEDYAIFFSCLRYTFFLDWTIVGFRAVASRIIGYLSSIIWNQPLVANFFG